MSLTVEVNDVRGVTKFHIPNSKHELHIHAWEEDRTVLFAWPGQTKGYLFTCVAHCSQKLCRGLDCTKEL